MKRMTEKPRRRPTIASFGPQRGGVRVLDDPGQRDGYYIVQWSVAGSRRVKTFPRTKEGRVEAIAFGQGVWDRKREGLVPKPRISIRELWEAYVTAVWDSLRPLTQRNYREHWRKFELFLGRDMIAEDVRAEDLDRFRQALRGQGIGVGNLQRMVTNIKTVYRWADERDLLSRNRVSCYRFRIAKEDRPIAPAEYGTGEPERILAELAKHRNRSDGWRPWAAVMLAAHTGKRMHQILHLRLEDVRFAKDEIVWPAAWEKGGKEKSQPLTWGAYAALLTCLHWRQRDEYVGPWLFYSAHVRKQRLGADPAATYHKSSLWLALVKAEVHAGVPHLARRAMHGFRRRVAGDILEATSDAKMALDYIGDSDLRQASRYLQQRDSRMEEAADIVDGAAQREAPDGGDSRRSTGRRVSKMTGEIRVDGQPAIGTSDVAGQVGMPVAAPISPKPSTNRQRPPQRGTGAAKKAAGTALSQQARQESNLQPPHNSPGLTPAKPRKSSKTSRQKSASLKQKRARSTPKPSTNRQRGRRP